jgi:hypothetical protein
MSDDLREPPAGARHAISRSEAMAHAREVLAAQRKASKDRIRVTFMLSPERYHQLIELCGTFDRKLNDMGLDCLDIGIRFFDDTAEPYGPPRVLDALPELRHPQIGIEPTDARRFHATINDDPGGRLARAHERSTRRADLYAAADPAEFKDDWIPNGGMPVKNAAFGPPLVARAPEDEEAPPPEFEGYVEPEPTADDVEEQEVEVVVE